MSDEAGNGSLGLELYQRQNAPHQPGLHGQEVRVVNLGDVIQVLAIGAVIVAGGFNPNIYIFYFWNFTFSVLCSFWYYCGLIKTYNHTRQKKFLYHLEQ